jgi:hypothetical protein
MATPRYMARQWRVTEQDAPFEITDEAGLHFGYRYFDDGPWQQPAMKRMSKDGAQSPTTGAPDRQASSFVANGKGNHPLNARCADLRWGVNPGCSPAPAAVLTAPRSWQR